jgi:hypothetical protein
VQCCVCVCVCVCGSESHFKQSFHSQFSHDAWSSKQKKKNERVQKATENSRILVRVSLDESLCTSSPTPCCAQAVGLLNPPNNYKREILSDWTTCPTKPLRTVSGIKFRTRPFWSNSTTKVKLKLFLKRQIVGTLKVFRLRDLKFFRIFL